MTELTEPQKTEEACSGNAMTASVMGAVMTAGALLVATSASSSSSASDNGPGSL
jgi:hypothetical protein